MLYDAYGKLISENNPSELDIQRGYHSYLKKIHNQRSSGNFEDIPIFFSSPRSQGRLSYHILRLLYETSSSIRPAVDSITREIYGIPWQIVHEDYRYHEDRLEEIITKFFNKINYDNQDIGQIISHFLNDLLVIGKGVIEKVRNVYGDIIELRYCDGANFVPVCSDYNEIIAYKESLPLGSKKPFRIHNKNDIIYKSFSTITYSFVPIPIIETIVNEVAMLMLTIRNIGSAFSNNDIPPGILHLGTIGKEALDRAEASFKQTKDISERGFSLKVVDNVDKVDWIQFTRPFREMQLAELVPIIERIIARNFGLASVDAGLASAEGRTSATVGKQSSQAKMLIPLMKMVETLINNEVLEEIYPGMSFIFTRSPSDTDLNFVDSLIKQFRVGLISLNEFRLTTGRKPTKGGDRRFVLLGNEFVPLDDVTGLPQYRIDLLKLPGRPSNKDEDENTQPEDTNENIPDPPSSEDVE